MRTRIIIKNIAFLVGRNLLMLWIASVAIFIISRLMPRTPMEVFLQRHGLPVTDEAIAQLRTQWGLDGSYLDQYLFWINGLLHGNWGVSILSTNSIAEQMANKVPVSLFIGLVGVMLATILAYPIGVRAALRGGAWETLSRVLTVISQAVPSFVIAILVINYLGVSMGLIPFYSLTGLPQLIAPTLILGFYSIGQLSRVVSKHVQEVMGQPFVNASLGRGFDLETIIVKHGRRQVLYGLVSALIAKMSWVIGGSTILEFIFAVPGMSTYIIESIKDRDYDVIQSYLMFLVLWMIGVHFICDALLRWLDPRTVQ